MELFVVSRIGRVAKLSKWERKALVRAVTKNPAVPFNRAQKSFAVMRERTVRATISSQTRSIKPF